MRHLKSFEHYAKKLKRKNQKTQPKRKEKWNEKFLVFGEGETEIDRLSRNGIVTGNNCWYSTRVKCAAHCAAFWQTYRWQFEHRLMLLMRLTRRMINANSLLLLATQSLLLSVLLVFIAVIAVAVDDDLWFLYSISSWCCVFLSRYLVAAKRQERRRRWNIHSL